MPFEIITPMIQNTTVTGTSLSAEIKTVSGSSVNTGSGQGSDTPFVVQSVESVTLAKLCVKLILRNDTPPNSYFETKSPVT